MPGKVIFRLRAESVDVKNGVLGELSSIDIFMR
jgi:hypothetical protein